ncbi:hypothetical protein [Thalassomonas haliotis]|uniref:DUF560 domain-containing protein n=1 Tax=Thalassomonas haliotis TaxID=485448 RepID=A0ABY7VGX0_9GAMM|nr:hypothetical protein [Thalassomonas haliotis]WDE12979.1 hypothetical protein H3N35_05850 [Thalassomonas haliotis]
MTLMYGVTTLLKIKQAMLTTITDVFAVFSPVSLAASLPSYGTRKKIPAFCPPTKQRQALVLVMFLLVSPQLIAKAISSAEQLKQAISLRKNSQYHQALELLNPLKKQHGDHKRINIELAFNYINLSDFHQANNIAAHIETLDLSTNEKKTLAALKQVIKENEKKQKASHLFATMLSTYAGIEEFTSRFPVDYYLEVADPSGFSPGNEGDYLSGPAPGAHYDNNGDYGAAYPEKSFPAEDSNYIVERSTAREKKQSSYRARKVKLKHHYRHNKKLQLFSTPLLFNWHNQFSLYLKQGQKKAVDNQVIERGKKLNYRQLKLDTGFNLLSDSLWLFNFKFSHRAHYYNGKRVLDEDKLIFSASVPITKNRLTLALIKGKRSYRDLYDLHNSHQASAALEYSLNFSPLLKLHLGSRYLQNNARDAYNKYDEQTFYGRLNYAFPPGALAGLTGFITLHYHRLMYEIHHPSLVNWGREYKQSIAAGLQYPLTANLTLGINGHLSRNNKNQQSGRDDWQRVEAFLSYRF